MHKGKATLSRTEIVMNQMDGLVRCDNADILRMIFRFVFHVHIFCPSFCFITSSSFVCLHHNHHLLSARFSSKRASLGLACAQATRNFLPCPRRFLEKAIRGPEPGAQVFEPLHPPPDLRAPTGRQSTFSFVFLCLSVCVALKLRSLHFTHPVYVASRYFQ